MREIFTVKTKGRIIPRLLLSSLLVTGLVTSSMGQNFKRAAALSADKFSEPVTVAVQHNKTNSITLQYAIPQMQTSTISAETHEQFTRIKLGNAPLHADAAGSPLLPTVPMQIVIPAGQEIDKINVTPDSRTVASATIGNPVEFMPAAIPLSLNAKVERAYANSAIYNVDNAYPSSTYKLVSVQKKRGMTIAIINICPVVYYPKSQRLLAYQKMTVDIQLKPVSVSTQRGALPARVNTLDPATLGVENPEDISTYQSAQSLNAAGTASGAVPTAICDPAQSFRYVVIAPLAIINATTDYNLNTLLQHKRSRGISATAVAVETIETSYSGVDTQEKIRNFIRDAYANWEADYILLAGDINWIPVRKLYVNASPYVDELPSDMYYQCLDGDFNSNGNTLWGEPNDGPGGTEVDLMSEVAIGRASASTVAKFSNFIYKTITYENAPANSPWLKKTLIAGEDLGTNFGSGEFRYAKTYSEHYRLGSTALGFTTLGFNSNAQYSADTLYARDGYSWYGSDISNVIATNQYGIINHVGHGNYNWVMNMDPYAVDLLQNTNPFFMLSWACISGNIEEDCVVEHLTNATRNGAFSAVANSRYGFGYYNFSNAEMDGPSHRINRQFWDGFFAKNIAAIGLLNANSHEANINYISNVYIRWCVYESNLIGDPQTPLRQVYTITATSGANGTISPIGEVATGIGTARTFTFTPNSGYHVEGFSIDGAYAGSTTTYTFPATTTGSHVINVSFAQFNQLPVANAGVDQITNLGTLVTLDGRQSTDPDNKPQPLTYSWSRISGPAVSLTGATTSQPTFQASVSGIYIFRLTVSDGEASSSDEVRIVTSDLAFTLTTTAIPAVGGTISGGGSYISGQPATLTATASAGFEFSSWSGYLVGPVNPAVITMDGNKSVTANFKLAGLTKVTPSTASASSIENASYPASAAIDGITTTRWASVFSDPQWIMFDMGSARSISTVVFDWESANARNYLLEGSNDASFVTKTTLVTKTNMATGDHRIDSLTGLTGTYRYYRMYGTARNTAYGYSIYEARFYTGGQIPNYTLTTTAVNGTVALLPAGGSYAFGTVVTLTATPAAGYAFSSWSGSVTGTTSPMTVTIDGNKSVTANFSAIPKYALTTLAVNGTVTLSPAGGPYTSGTVVTLTANPATGYVFSSWSGDITSTINPESVIMNANKAVTANFTLKPTLVKQTVSSASASSIESSATAASAAIDNNTTTRWASVFSDPQWIMFDMGSAKAITVVVFDWEAANARNYTLEGSNDVTFAIKTTLVTKTNMASGDHRIDSLTGLTGSYRYYRMYGTARNLTYGYSIYEARFYSNGNTPNYTLATSATNGTVTLSPAGGTYASGTVVTMTANANSGYAFGSWSGSVTGTTSPTTVIMDGNKSVTANFVVVPTYTLTTSAINGTVTLSPAGGTYASGTVVTMTANANSGYAFGSWSGSATGTTSPTTITMNANKSVTANFTQTVTYTVTSSFFGNGTISPLGVVNTPVGTARTYTITPMSGYVCQNLMVDNMAVVNTSSYTFPATTTGSHTIVAHFLIINQVPIANAGPDQIVTKNSLVTLDGSASYDPDHQPYPDISFTWTQTSGPSVVLTEWNSIKPTFTPTVTGSYTFNLRNYDWQDVAEDNVTITVTDGGTVLPGRIEVENYKAGGEGVGYHDLTNGNTGAVYKNDNVDIESCSDVGLGYDVGWTDAGEWLAYDVVVQSTGTYTLTARAASGLSGTKTLTVTVDGSTVATFNSTDASGWQSWKDMVVPNVSLTAGSHVVRMTMTTGGLNLNYLDVSVSSNNLLTNGDFSNGLTGWEQLVMGSAAGSFANDANSAKVTIATQGSNAYDIQMFQRITLVANKTYTLEFDVKAASNPKDFKIVIEHDGDPWTKYVETQRTVDLAVNTWKHFSISFIPNANDSNVKLGFHFGTFNTSSVWIDNVVLK